MSGVIDQLRGKRRHQVTTRTAGRAAFEEFLCIERDTALPHLPCYGVSTEVKMRGVPGRLSWLRV